jgi:hypothetical protein
VQLLLAAIVVAPVVVLVVGAVRGRVTVRACCPDPAHDKRLAGAFDDAASAPSAPGVTSPRGSS